MKTSGVDCVCYIGATRRISSINIMMKKCSRRLKTATETQL